MEKTGANQFTTGKRKGHSLETKLKMASDAAVECLTIIVNDKNSNQAAQVAAAKAILDKTAPSLQAIDSTIRHDEQAVDEDALVERIRALLRADPALLSKVLADIAKESDQPLAEAAA